MNGFFKVYPAGAYSLIAIVIFILLLIIIVPLFILGVAGAAFARLGFSWIEAVAVILLMVIGSFINIPLHTFRRRYSRTGGGEPVVFDAFSGEPVYDETMVTTLSLNIGGAVIPAGVCIYLFSEVQVLDIRSVALPLAACFILVALVTFAATKVLPAWGLRAPLFLPALTALVCGLLLTGGTPGIAAGVTAFAGGTLGTMAGAAARGVTDGIREGIGQVSIGGSGMFGPIFLCAVLAALAA